jgi:hypothetical protein
MRTRSVSALGLLPILFSVLQGCGFVESTQFSARPSAAVTNGRVVIEFALSQPVDYAVLIKDRNGHAVRHLAARAANVGVQRLAWDGCTDAGLPAPAGEYRVEVALGLTPVYETSFGDDPESVAAVHGLAVGPNGALYVLGGGGHPGHDARFAVFGPNAAYRRTILPRPGRLPLDRVRPLGEVVLDGGEHVPLSLLPQYGGPRDQAPVVAPDGDLIFVNGSMRYHAERHRFLCADRMNSTWPRRLLRLAPDGGAPDEGVLGPVLGKPFAKRVLHLALSSDGKTVYVSGAQHAVFTVRWEKDARPEPFVGTPGTAGKGETGLKDPCGIALDAKGNLYVADRGNHRIACFSPAGELLGEIAVEWPRQVAVHPKTGAVYAACGYRKHRLLAFAGLDARKPVYECPLASSNPILAADVRGRKTVLYVGNVTLRDPKSGAARTAVVSYVADDEGLRMRGVVTSGSAATTPGLLGVDRERELVYGVSRKGYMRWDGTTGRRESVPMRQHPKSSNASEMTCGRDGTVVFHVPGEIGRFDREFLPVPYAPSGSYITRLFKADGVLHGRDLFAAPDGAIYRIHERGGQNKPMRVSTVRPDGTPGRDSIVVLDTRSAAGLRVDRDGNLYLLDHLKPLDQHVHPDLAGKVDVVRHHPFVYHVGSVLKFRPEGGSVRQLSNKPPVDRDLKPGQKQFTTAEGRGDFVADGLLWSWYGVSMITPALDRGRYSPYTCVCVTPRFDLDDFARVFVPDQLRCRVVVLDTDGRFITSFGQYGNADETGPELRFADPRTVMVSRTAAYVGDQQNRRVIKARLTYRERAACRIRLPKGVATASLPLRITQLRDRLAALRDEVKTRSPSLDAALDWNRVAERVNRRTAGLSMDDIRAEFAVLAPRDAAGWRDDEATALLGGWMNNGSERVRLGVVWGLSGGRLGAVGRKLLVTALRDQSERVRMAAAYVLLDRDDPAGLAEVFRGALSENPDVYKLAETSMLRKLLVWDASHPLAGAIDRRVKLVPVYKMDREAVLALGDLLSRSKAWYFRRSALFLLGTSGDPAAAPPLLRAMRRPERDRNLNRCIGGLGLLRHREAVPDLLKYVARGHGPKFGTKHYNGDEAESYAGVALVRTADPKSVAPLITMLDAEKPRVREVARRTLTDLFASGVPADRCLVPRDGSLEQARVDDLPAPADLRKAWATFWKANAAKYAWPSDGPPLKAGG